MVWSDDTEKFNPFQQPLQNVNGLLYALLVVPKVLSPILSSFVEKSFLNHVLIIMSIIMFENTLLKNLQQGRKVLIVMDNAKYHR